MYGGSPRMRPGTASPRAALSPRAGLVPPPGGLAPLASPRLSPRSFRPTSAPVRPTSAAVRAGGRLYVQSPLDGMSENEMINEARIRMAHNKQRAQLKRMLNVAADGGSTVATNELLLACRIAKLDVGTDSENEVDNFLMPNHVASRDCRGTPRQIAWKSFHQSIAYPELHPPGTFPGELPLTRGQQKQYRDYQTQMAALSQQQAHEAEAEAKKGAPVYVSDEDLRKYHKILKRALETRFAELRRAFRLIDQDQSGDCDRDELKYMLQAMFNLTIPEPIMDKIIDLADFDGDGSINFAEFARIATEDDVLNMKKTLQADVSNWGTQDPIKVIQELDKQAMAAQRRKAQGGGYEDGGYHPKLRRTGPGLDELRRAHRTLKRAINARFPSAKEAFKSIDKDGSGTLRRNELRRFLHTLAKTVPDRAISGLIDFCDDDGDNKTLSMDEFCKLMTAAYLGAGGFDPNAQVRVK